MLCLRSRFLVLILVAIAVFAPVADRPGYHVSAVAQGGGGFNAEAICVITGAHGTAYGYRSSKEAIDAAIAACTAKGGVPA
jgi:hypothetical protein